MALRISLRQLFIGLTAWCVGIAGFVVEIPERGFLVTAIAASIAVLFFFAKCDNVLAAMFISFPLICLANWGFFFVAFGHAFGDPHFEIRLFGPIAEIVSKPVIMARNSLPFGHPWSGFFGLALVSLLETAALGLATATWRSRRKDHARDSNLPNWL